MNVTPMTEQTVQEKIRSVMESSFHRRASIKKTKLTDEVELEKILEENIFTIGHILLDLHEEFQIAPNYEPLSEFELFKTPLDIVKYIEKRI